MKMKCLVISNASAHSNVLTLSRVATSANPLVNRRCAVQSCRMLSLRSWASVTPSLVPWLFGRRSVSSRHVGTRPGSLIRFAHPFGAAFGSLSHFVRLFARVGTHRATGLGVSATARRLLTRLAPAKSRPSGCLRQSIPAAPAARYSLCHQSLRSFSLRSCQPQPQTLALRSRAGSSARLRWGGGAVSAANAGIKGAPSSPRSKERAEGWLFGSSTSSGFDHAPRATPATAP
jgi:hypothetical protein